MIEMDPIQLNFTEKESEEMTFDIFSAGLAASVSGDFYVRCLVYFDSKMYGRFCMVCFEMTLSLNHVLSTVLTYSPVCLCR